MRVPKASWQELLTNHFYVRYAAGHPYLWPHAGLSQSVSDTHLPCWEYEKAKTLRKVTCQG